MLKTTNVAVVQNFEAMSDKFNFVYVSTCGNYAKKSIAELYNY